jgi:predicted aldo/keto reductase-like oxidoreductase
MQYKIMKKSGDKISILGFGCLRFPEKNGKIDKEKSKELLLKAYELGINYFDTGYPYHMGESEPFLGEVFSNSEMRQKIKIATKLPPFPVNEKKDMDTILRNQLKRLKTDHIDYYLLHGIDEKSWDKLMKLDVLEFLTKSKKEGMIGSIGFSYHGFIDTFKQMVDTFDWDLCQIQYNYLDEELQAGKKGLEYAASKEIDVFIMEPLRGGVLAKKQPQSIAKTFDESEIKRTPAEWALRWIWNHKEVTMVLSGMSRMDQLLDNAKIADSIKPSTFSKNEIETVEKLKIEYKKIMKINCTSCQYCQPCPANVNIPVCFDFYNRIKVLGDNKFQMSVMYGIHLGGIDTDKKKMEFASQCNGCGECEKKCPQHIEIRKWIKVVKKEIETITFKPIMLFVKLFYNRIK